MDYSDTHEWRTCCEYCGYVFCNRCSQDEEFGCEHACKDETAEHRQERLADARAEANHNNERAQNGTLAERRGKE